MKPGDIIETIVPARLPGMDIFAEFDNPVEFIAWHGAYLYVIAGGKEFAIDGAGNKMEISSN